MHWLSDCPKASDAEKVALRLKLREASKARGSRVKRLKMLMPAASRTVTINGVLELLCCTDSGSDHTVISRSRWDLLIAADPNEQQTLLDTPVQCLTFGSHPVVAKTQALLHVLIHTAAGPVEPAEAVPCVVVDMDDDQFIIGRDLLATVGIDVDRQLEQLATHRDDETSGDPFNLEADEPPAERQAATDDEVRAAVEDLIERALQHGFPPDKADKLRLIVFAYDVWRLELRDDLPALLEVRSKEGAQPSKCKPRKYPPHIRQFLREFNQQLVDLGLVYENPTSRWASPVLPVKKSHELMDLRQTTDYREINSVTEVMAAVMPILSLVMENARGKQHFGLFDFLKGFWQLPLAELCQ
ncbi:hypothetical protein PF007_g6940 [Phytophthora fragariae]|uniref:Reverse transcriptase/retrotransposon-derived protein RNase H-like domain-containing protein n=1 Tax=Phytophthora fragariae TaxID=53985 RepID=A0A6A4E345_9STRA|nr:hypothetical protein PF003_g3725 [Phytophthora fragariae]KAE8942776.1 hypothetical protein PF009_g7482 [Phytophthora fragariae]KAE9106889.1 hypothetical protein PF006_g21252 [Phytophthora fragariae]KAE9123772.1 hypothetical protein PF007_g6940 [Phytophthora fragariae]KAE9246102.1 hypothetical protein PF004_g4954 [Phytophthora fragariae]